MPEIRDLYRQGWSVRALAQRYNISKNTILRHLGDEARPGGTKVLALSTEEMTNLYAEGYSLLDIAEKAGVSYQTVTRRLKAAGIQLRPNHVRTEKHRAKMSAARYMQIPEQRLRELQAQQMSCREIATELGGCSEEKIRDDLIRLGLPRLLSKARPHRNAFWRGGYTVDDQGYILVKMPEHPQTDAGGYVRQHRLVMEQELGRYLLPTEVVDHRNADTSDNRPENLRVFQSNGEHLRATRTGRPKLPPEVRERLRQEAVQRARQRVAAILSESGNDVDP